VFVLCSIGQNLANLELQVVLATMLARFSFSPGPELEQELKLAAAAGQPAVSVHALAGFFITLQPMSGQMMLRVSRTRGLSAAGVEAAGGLQARLARLQGFACGSS
jgi:hypothetical protein